MTSSRSGRAFFPFLDALRCLSALMVVAYHTPAFFGYKLARGYLAVDMFFVLSGVVVANSYERSLLDGMSFRLFVWIRMLRLYPLFFLGLLLGVAAFLAGNSPMMDGLTLRHTLIAGLFMLPKLWPLQATGSLNATLYPLNDPSWSLFFELAVNFAYALLVRHLTTRRLVNIAAVSGMVLIAIALKNRSLNFGWRPRQIPLGLIRTTYSFSMGVLIFRKLPQIMAKKAILPRWPMTVFLSLTIVCLLALGPPAQAGPIYDLVCVIAAFPIVIVCSLSLKYGTKTCRAFAIVGVASYSIYVLHIPCRDLATILLRGIHNPPTSPWLGCMFLLASFSVACDPCGSFLRCSNPQSVAEARLCEGGATPNSRRNVHTEELTTTIEPYEREQ